MHTQDYWHDAARAAAGDVAASLVIADELGVCLADARHSEIVDVLTSIAAADLTTARVVEPHLDALIVQREAGIAAPVPGRWGVFAAEDPRFELRAENVDGRWRMTGTKAWCSLAGAVDHALITATTDGGRRLFAVDLCQDGVYVQAASGWVAQGLPNIVSVPIDLDGVAAEPVGGVEWYLSRPGFAWGAVRVAACWQGAVTGLVDYLREAVGTRYPEDRLRLYNLGRADVANWSAQLATRHAAAAIDDEYAMPATRAQRLAERTRAVVAAAAETALTHAGHALGPAPLAFDAGYVRRTADLMIYIRQHHAERDLAALGANLVNG